MEAGLAFGAAAHSSLPWAAAIFTCVSSMALFLSFGSSSSGSDSEASSVASLREPDDRNEGGDIYECEASARCAVWREACKFCRLRDVVGEKGRKQDRGIFGQGGVGTRRAWVCVVSCGGGDKDNRGAQRVEDHLS